jgi:uncharacterized protein
MKIVLDTNVLVSGLLTPFGTSGEIVRMVIAGELTLCLDARILSEYREVLKRPKFGFDQDRIDTLLGFIKQFGLFVLGTPLAEPLPDPDDEPFLEVALCGEARVLITGNKAHFPKRSTKRMNTFSPSEFIKWHRKQRLK